MKLYKNTKSLLYTTLFSAICNTLLNIPLIYFWGALGAAVSTAFSYLILYIMRINGSRKVFQFEIDVISISISILLLVIESILVYIDNIYGNITAVMVLLLIVIINREVIYDYLKLLKV